MSARRRSESATRFTMIHLMLVISTVAILSAILFPGFASSRMSERTSSGPKLAIRSHVSSITHRKSVKLGSREHTVRP